MKRALLSATALLGVATLAQAADSAPAVPTPDGSLSMYGITLYGTVDVGVAYQSHGTPLDGDYPTGLEYLISKNSNKSITTIAPNGLSQSKIGIKGEEAITDQLSGIFKVEIGFSPTSGELANGPKAEVKNNGVALADQTSNGDSSRAGQLFNGAAYAGLTYHGLGTVTVGRQNSLMLDDILAYDPQGGSYAFSPIGYSGAAGGVGDTEDARLDQSIKYSFADGPYRAAALYQFGGSDSEARSAYEFDVGVDMFGFSVDAIYNHVNDAIGVSPLSSKQLGEGAPGGSLSATVSDNSSFGFMGKYATGPVKLYVGWERIQFDNPSTPLAAGATTIGGYTLGVVNDAAYNNNKLLDIIWGGVKYAVTPQFDVTGAYYHYEQHNYDTVPCSNASSSKCAGQLDAVSIVADYKLSKRFDIYGGAMYSQVANGLSNEYLNKSTIDPMIGARYSF